MLNQNRISLSLRLDSSEMKSLSFLIIFVVLVVVAECQRSYEDHRNFKDWCKKHNKKYGTQEEQDRAMDNLMSHKKTIDAHNKEYREGKKSFKMGLSEHHDMTMDEIIKYRTGVMQDDSKKSKRSIYAAPNYPKAPASVDWRENGLVTEVQDQGACGSCWAFSAAAVVDAVIRKQKRHRHASVQQLISCSKTSYGCAGGFPDKALEYVKENGIASASDYPYEEKNGTCEYTQNEKIATVKEVYYLSPNGNETFLK